MPTGHCARNRRPCRSLDLGSGFMDEDGVAATGQRWSLDFYNLTRPWAEVEDLVPGLGDVSDRARRNGAIDGTPIFIDPTGRADYLVNLFWRVSWPGALGLKEGSVRRYAYSLKVWLDFLHAVGSTWRTAGRDELAAFKRWRLSADQNPDVVSPNAFRIDLAAIRRFYDFASGQCKVENPVYLRAVVGAVHRSQVREQLQGAPSAIRRADVKWLTPEAFRLWRDIGLRGFAADELPAERWVGRSEDRDVAFVEGLFGTGLRLGEWSSQLVIEMPESHQEGLFRGRLSASCTKTSVGRPFWMRRRVAQLVRYYVDDGGRRTAITRAQAAGRYADARGRWLIKNVHPGGMLNVVDDAGRTRDLSLDAIAPHIRMRLFTETDGGLEPAWLWLNQDGMPRPKTAWYNTFHRANDRVARTLAGSGPRLWCRPHMLRHSFALRWYCIATFVAWHRTHLLTAAEQRDYRHQLGDVWYLMATLLGHSSAEVTRGFYLEPFTGLEVEHLIKLMDSDDRRALESLVNAVAAEEPRVLKVGEK